MRYLLDSDWAIEFLKGNPPFVDRIRTLEPFGIAISTIVLAELYDGVAGAYDPEESERDLRRLAAELTTLVVDHEIARIYGFERQRLRRQGQPIPPMDLLIAATALRHQLTLLTNNRRHFDRFPNLTVQSI